jgi:hypothetical protein
MTGLRNTNYVLLITLITLLTCTILLKLWSAEADTFIMCICICVLPMYWLWMHTCTHRHKIWHRHGSVTYKPFLLKCDVVAANWILTHKHRFHVQNTIVHNLAALKLLLRSQTKTEIWSCHRDYNKNLKSHVSWNEHWMSQHCLFIW